MTVSSPNSELYSMFRRYHDALPCNADHKRYCVSAIKGTWTPLVAAGAVGFLFIFLVIYQRSTPWRSDDNIERHMNMPFVRSVTFNCSDIGLHGQTIQEENQYHVFPNNSDGRSTCQSKYQQHCFRKHSTPKYFPPPKFLAALRDYETYHERCTRGHNLSALALKGEVPTNCKYLVWKAMDGMGNQLVSIVTAFMYALLTKRTMLIATDSHIDNYLCNPFPFSTWVLPEGFPEWQLRTNAKRLYVYLNEVLQKQQRSCSVSDNLPRLIAEAPQHLHVYIMCCDRDRDHQFFCPTAQKLLSGVHWMFYQSHEYTLSAFYFVPEFRRMLNDWFPQNDVFMHGARYMLNPENALWSRITQLYKKYMDGSGRQIGIQVRSWSEKYNATVSRQILRCAVEQGLVPRPLPQFVNSSTQLVTKKKSEKISVLVASLRSEYYQNLAFEFDNHLNSKNSSVKVFTVSTEGVQKTGDREHDERAIIDIWLLSFVHDMVITPLSTFGSSASGLAGIKPLLFNNYEKDKLSEPACVRTNLVGPCFIRYPRNQPCDLDPARSSIFDPGLMVPEIKMCEYNNPGLGILSEG